jgi:arsenate reductase
MSERHSPPERPFNVLFLCTGNSARSVMAEAILNRDGLGRFKAFSAGSHPTGEVHPYTIQLLQKLNYPTAELRSKSWDEFATADAPKLDFVFTVCDDAANEVCPIWPGQERRLAFADAYRMMNNRIGIFINLPIASVDRLSLQSKLAEIGKS